MEMINNQSVIRTEESSSWDNLRTIAQETQIQEALELHSAGLQNQERFIKAKTARLYEWFLKN